MRRAARTGLLSAMLLGAAACPAWAAASASAFPAYDAGQYCHRMAGLSGGAKAGTLFHNCMASESKQRSQAQTAWDKAPQATRQRCDALSRSVGIGRYARLRSCLEKHEAHRATHGKAAAP